MTRRLRPLLILAAVLACCGPAAASAAQHELAVSEGTVAAKLTYQQEANSIGPREFAGLTLQISRAGQVFYDRPVSSQACLSACQLETFRTAPLAVKDLEENAQPDVILHLNTGGAHCCTVVQVLAFDPGTGTYGLVERDFGDPGARLTDVAGDGSLEFESADDRFAYLFTSYVYSGLPLQIWRFHEGRFVDATRSFPQALTADAARQFKYFLATRKRGHGLGLLAAWAADEELLGRGALVTSTLRREQRAHRLRSAEAPSQGGGVYVRKLERFLAKSGYTA
jgi:hypothetical protein